MAETRPPWAAEREVTAALARELIRERFPALAARRVEPFGSGWDNSAFRVDGAMVFRFPRRESAAGLLRTEARVLPALAPRLPLPVPHPRWLGEPTERFPWPFLGYPRLAGRTACSARLSAGAAEALGGFLAALHASPPGELPLPGDDLRRTDFASRLPLLEERLAALRGAGLIEDARPWLRLFDGADPGGSGRPPVVVHGDLYARHLLVGPRGEVAGVLDWGDVHLGDPAVDLSVAFLLFPPEGREALARAYGPVDARAWSVARRRAAFHAASTAWFALSVGDADLLGAGRRALGFVLQG
jgi:aminoglycoside phosphotransferase (APT) family kinase protein